MRIETNLTATMASFTQNEESFSNDSNYFTYNKLTDRISSFNFDHLFELEENQANGVLSIVRANGLWSAIPNDLLH